VTPGDWPSSRGLEALAAKYEELARLRMQRTAGGPVAPRAQLRDLASRFPGALRELETMAVVEIHARAAALRNAAERGDREPWMAWLAAYHLLLRLGGDGASDDLAAGAPSALLAARAGVHAPGVGRRTEEAIRAIAAVFEAPRDDVARALLPRRRHRDPATRSTNASAEGKLAARMTSDRDTRTRILSASDVRSLLSMEKAVAAVERAFADHARGLAQMPAKVYLSLEQHAGDFRAMPSYVEGHDGAPPAAGVKWVNSHPDNPKRHGLPSVMGVYILSDPATALPLAVLDATVLTAARTGAAAAVASKHLAKPGARTIGFIGSGVQARYMLDAHRVIYGDALEVLAADIDPRAAEAFASAWGGRVVSVEEAAGCDIVCASTPGRTRAVERAWVRPGAHINAMGADAPGKQELDAAILQQAIIVIDEHHQATHSGEINVPLSTGALHEDRIFATLGEVIIGTKKPARSAQAITVFDSTGLAVQDVALARVLFEDAASRDLGTLVQLVST
jgi:ornithine cyclodeaminase/alanine dehydrogenase